LTEALFTTDLISGDLAKSQSKTHRL